MYTSTKYISITQVCYCNEMFINEIIFLMYIYNNCWKTRYVAIRATRATGNVEYEIR